MDVCQSEAAVVRGRVPKHLYGGSGGGGNGKGTGGNGGTGKSPAAANNEIGGGTAGGVGENLLGGEVNFGTPLDFEVLVSSDGNASPQLDCALEVWSGGTKTGLGFDGISGPGAELQEELPGPGPSLACLGFTIGEGPGKEAKRRRLGGAEASGWNSATGGSSSIGSAFTSVKSTGSTLASVASDGDAVRVINTDGKAALVLNSNDDVALASDAAAASSSNCSAV